jgi:hypothetical protein
MTSHTLWRERNHSGRFAPERAIVPHVARVGWWTVVVEQGVAAQRIAELEE